MDHHRNVENEAQAIIKALENPSELPEPLALSFFLPRDDVPCRTWSWPNQLRAIKNGFVDSRSFSQWRQVGRHVKRGERAFYISAPITKERGEADPCRDREKVIRFRGVPVFGLEQTDGDPLPAASEEQKWVESLPVIEVARQWKLPVRLFDARTASVLGMYHRQRGILLGVKNLATWAHELVHAADDRLGNLTAHDQHHRREVVAELGASIMLRLLGHEVESDLGGCRRCIRYQVFREGLTVADACGRVLDRACAAVRLILDAAEAVPRFGVSP